MSDEQTQRLVLEKQADTVAELKAESRQLTRLQAAVVGAIIAGLGLAADRIQLGVFVTTGSLEGRIGMLLLLTAGVAFFSVFLLLPRPFCKVTHFEELVSSNICWVQQIDRFQFPTDGDIGKCIHDNEEMIKTTEQRLQQLHWLNIVGYLALLGWVGAQLFVAG